MHFAVTECSFFFIKKRMRKKCKTSVVLVSSKYTLRIDTKFTVKKILKYFVDINFLPFHTLDSLQNVTKTSILNDTYL